MRTILGFIGAVLIVIGAAALVAELLHLVVGDSSGLLSLERVWKGVHGPSLSGVESSVGGSLGGVGATAIGWLLALPSWLVFLVIGLPLFLAGRRTRERGFG